MSIKYTTLIFLCVLCFPVTLEAVEYIYYLKKPGSERISHVLITNNETLGDRALLYDEEGEIGQSESLIVDVGLEGKYSAIKKGEFIQRNISIETIEDHQTRILEEAEDITLNDVEAAITLAFGRQLWAFLKKRYVFEMSDESDFENVLQEVPGDPDPKFGKFSLQKSGAISLGGGLLRPISAMDVAEYVMTEFRSSSEYEDYLYSQITNGDKAAIEMAVELGDNLRQTYKEMGKVVVTGSEVYLGLIGMAVGPYGGGFEIAITIFDVSRMEFDDPRAFMDVLALAKMIRRMKPGTDDLQRFTILNETGDVVATLSRAALTKLEEIDNFPPGDKIREMGPFIGEMDEATKKHVFAELLCFPVGTQVATGPGAYRNIEDLRPGDIVLSYKEGADTLEYVRVLDVEWGLSRDLVMLIANDGRLVSTYGHLFYAKRGANEFYEWVEAGELSSGDLVKTSDGLITLRDVENLSGEYPVVSISTTGSKTYFVGAIGAVVHNECFKTVLNDLKGPNSQRSYIADYLSGNWGNSTSEEVIHEYFKANFYEFTTENNKVVKSAAFHDAKKLVYKSAPEDLENLKAVIYSSEDLEEQYRVKMLATGWHEMIPRTNLMKIMNQAANLNEVKKAVAAMDNIRVPTGLVLYKRYGRNSDGIPYGHNTNFQQVDTQTYDALFHDALSESFDKAFTGGIFNITTLHAEMVNVVNDFCRVAGDTDGASVEEILRFIAAGVENARFIIDGP